MWNIVLLEYLRILLNDVDCDDYRYSDNKLLSAILYAAYKVEAEMDFSNSYTINIVKQSITPDPVESNDINFINLVLLQAACIVINGELRVSSLNSIKVIDGPSTIDMASQYKNIEGLYNSLLKDYEQLKMTYLTGNVGKAILTPYSPGSNSIRGDLAGHRGQFFTHLD